MNLPNKLTIARLLSVPVIMMLLVAHEHNGSNGVALACSLLADLLFIGACITDYYDGKIARSMKLQTNFGKLMDPVADKVLVISVFIQLVEMHVFPAWTVAVILAREFIVTGIRLLVLQNKTQLLGDGGGKVKAGWQMATIISVLTFVTLQDAAKVTAHPATTQAMTLITPRLPWLYYVLMAITLWYTVASGWRYMRLNRELLMATND